jgi:hypothetical protein
MSATAQQHDDRETLFMFDNCIGMRPMNESGLNEGGFEASELNRWLQKEFWYRFPDYIRQYLLNVSIPSYGMMFGGTDTEQEDKFVDSDSERQLVTMRCRKNRIATLNNGWTSYWLKNKMTGSDSCYLTADEHTGFIAVNAYGDYGYCYASKSLGVRPIFTLSRKEK